MSTEEAPHDILAAEEFGLGDADPELRHEPVHDVLAAEEFPLPAPDRSRSQGPRDAHAEDPEAHDVLAAEEFAMPAPIRHAVPPEAPPRTSGSGRIRLGAGMLLTALLLGALVRRLRS